MYLQLDYLKQLYETAKKEVLNSKYAWEVNLVEKRVFEEQTPKDFLIEYVFVVCNSGMRNQVAEKIFERYMEQGIVAIKHPLKKKAILEAEQDYKKWFETLKIRKQHHTELDFLGSLPHIGKITKYHLARNLGFDVAKPDRHMQKLAELFGYVDPNHMCIDLHMFTGGEYRVGTIDVILWRFCNLNPNYLEMIKNYKISNKGQDIW